TLHGFPQQKLLCIDGRYYEAKFTAAGDALTLVPSRAAVGRVTSPHEGFHALLYGDQGTLKIACDKSHPAILPEGTWRLLSYTIEAFFYTAPVLHTRRPRTTAR
ncbi:MAG: hypothetical protein ABR915_11085, partial [Thermoguttaceae bacterium]